MLNPAAGELEGLVEQARASKYYTRLSAAQYSDGSWGRFHTENTKQKQPVPTTEIGLRCALESGLPQTDPILRNVVGGLDWRDWHEKHDNPDAWPWHVRNISAANLALIDPAHPLLDDHRAFWRHVAEAAFAGGSYNAEAEKAAYNDAAGHREKHPPVCWRNYALILLSTDPAGLPTNLEQAITRKFLAEECPWVCEEGMWDLGTRHLDMVEDLYACLVDCSLSDQLRRFGIFTRNPK